MRPNIPIEKITALPAFYSTTVTEDHLDAMGHMNVRWYLAFFDEGGWRMLQSYGMTEEYYRTRNNGGFALQHFIGYWAEVRLGETITVHSRLVGYSAKRIHFMHFMVNNTRNVLASTLEGLGAHADLSIRRMSPYPPDIIAQIKAIYDEHNVLDWDAPTCGIIHA